MAKKAFVYDGTQWVDIAQSTTDLSNYANMTTTPISGFRNAIINGDFRIWQRGTSANTSTSEIYTADRWVNFGTGGTGAARSLAQVSFTPGNEIPGYESQYYYRYQVTTAGTGAFQGFGQRIEDVRTFAGQTVTFSFWAKASSAITATIYFQQFFGSGGSPAVTTSGDARSITTSWQRFTVTTTLASISGKTINSGSYLVPYVALPNTGTYSFDIWGVQLEQGSIATPFEQRPFGLELSLCQRYHYRITAKNSYGYIANGVTHTNSVGAMLINFPVPLRDTPTFFGSSSASTFGLLTPTFPLLTGISMSTDGTNPNNGAVNFNGTFTGGQGAIVRAANNSNAYIEFGAEL